MVDAHRYCLKCRYVLDGLTSPRCPECGTHFDLENPQTYSSEPPLTFGVNRVARIALVALVFLLLELVCVRFVWETAGEVAATFVGMIVIFGDLIVLSSVFLNRPRLTTLLLSALILLTVPYPVFLRIKLSFLESEAHRIIAYAETTRVQTGSYPPDLSGYQFHHSWTAASFIYAPDGFWLHWWAEQPGVSHSYSPARGFGYYPD